MSRISKLDRQLQLQREEAGDHLYANRVRVYPKSVHGPVRNAKWAILIDGQASPVMAGEGRVAPVMAGEGPPSTASFNVNTVDSQTKSWRDGHAVSDN